MSDKKSFVFYETAYEPIKELSKDDQLMFYEAIIRYGLYGELPEFTGKDKAIWYLIQFGIDEAKKRRETSISNGSKGGRPNKPTETEENQTEIIETQNNLEKPNETQNNLEKPNHNLNVNANVNANVNDNATANNDEQAAAELLTFDKRKKEFDGAICLLFNTKTNMFTPDFTVGVLKLCEQYSVSNIPKYLKYVYDTVKKKNPSNFSGLFYKMAQSPDVMQSFIQEFRPNKPAIEYSKCECCGSTINANLAMCPVCRFDLTRKNENGYVQEWRELIHKRGFG